LNLGLRISIKIKHYKPPAVSLASIAAIKFALSNNEKIFIVTQRDITEEEPMFTGLYTVGVIAEVKQVLRVTEGGKTLRVVVEGLRRAV
jgi:ATP-dependent Lon protease